VYALGALLYELLTGRPPFRAGSPLDTMLLVKQDDPVAPSRFHPRLSRDLETICLKCLEKDPSKRYQSAQLLAEDLNRFLQGRPIVARRIGWPGVLWRWSCRNPGWATVAVLSAAVVLALAVGGPIVAQHEYRLREQALASKRDAQKERDRASEQFVRASKVLSNVLEQTLTSSRLRGTTFDEIRTGLVRAAVPYYEQFLDSDSSHRSARKSQGLMLAQLAAIYEKEGQPEKARMAYSRSMERLETLNLADGQPESQIHVHLAQVHTEYGRFLQIVDKDRVGAEQHYLRALSLLAEPLELNDGNVRDKEAIALSLLGVLISPSKQRADESEAMLARAAKIRDQLVQDFPHRDDFRHYAALTHMNLGLHYRTHDDYEGEIRELERAWECEHELMNLATQSSEAPYFTALLEGELASALDQVGRQDDAMRHLASARRIAKALRLAFPAVEKFVTLQENLENALRQEDEPDVH
jgi:tetratricopeptide (TPR) repeat protein